MACDRTREAPRRRRPRSRWPRATASALRIRKPTARGARARHHRRLVPQLSPDRSAGATAADAVCRRGRARAAGRRSTGCGASACEPCHARRATGVSAALWRSILLLTTLALAGGVAARVKRKALCLSWLEMSLYLTTPIYYVRLDARTSATRTRRSRPTSSCAITAARRGDVLPHGVDEHADEVARVAAASRDSSLGIVDQIVGASARAAEAGSRTTSSPGRRRESHDVTRETSGRSTTRASFSNIDDGRVLGHDRTDAARPLFEGTCPICGFEFATRRPVRQLWQPARSSGSTNPGRRSTALNQLGRPLIFPRAAGLQRAVARMDRTADALAPERAAVLAELVKELKPRPITRDLDWGIPVPCRIRERSRRLRLDRCARQLL